MLVGGLQIAPSQIAAATSWPAVPIWLGIYSMLLVALVGQTPGMLVAGLRVVRPDFRSPSLGQCVWRYVLAVVLWPIIIVLSPFSPICLHDKWSYTRVIKTERVLARATLPA